MQRLSRLQVCEAELYRREVHTMRRRRTGRKARPQRQHVLRVQQLSEVQIHFGQQAHCGKVPGLRKRIPGGKELEIRSMYRMPQQGVLLRTLNAANVRRFSARNITERIIY